MAPAAVMEARRTQNVPVWPPEREPPERVVGEQTDFAAADVIELRRDTFAVCEVLRRIPKSSIVIEGVLEAWAVVDEEATRALEAREELAFERAFKQVRECLPEIFSDVRSPCVYMYSTLSPTRRRSRGACCAYMGSTAGRLTHRGVIGICTA